MYAVSYCGDITIDPHAETRPTLLIVTSSALEVHQESVAEPLRCVMVAGSAEKERMTGAPRTVTVRLAVDVSPRFVAIRVKVVVAVTGTLREPLASTAPIPLIVTDSAFETAQCN